MQLSNPIHPMINHKVVQFGRYRAVLPLAFITLSLAGSVSTRASILKPPSLALSDVSSAIKSAAPGDTVLLPAGTVTWTSGISISNAIKIVGAGSGQLIGHSETVVTIGTGSKTFTLTVRPNSGTGVSYAPSPGDTVRANMPANGANFMQGTVTSYSGNTLVVNVTSTGGSGTYGFWTFSTPAVTTIINSASNASIFTLNEPATGNIDLSGICFVAQNSGGHHISINGTQSTSQAALVHDCYFRMAQSGLGGIFAYVNKGVVFRCSIDNEFANIGGYGYANTDPPFQFKHQQSDQASFDTSSTMGMNDSDGQHNFYIEDCYFAANVLTAWDFDDCSRTVVRYCVLDNTGASSHGPDSSPIGVRHFEIYNNTYVFTNYSNSTVMNIQTWQDLRGGTGVIANNVIPSIHSQNWGNRPTLKLRVEIPARNTGPYACWTGGYPAPHQVGQGYGTGAVYHDFNTTYAGAPWNAYYYVYAEPLYMWGNSGAGATSVELANFNAPPYNCTNYQSVNINDWLQSGRDYIVGTAKPGWTPYTYPHPLTKAGAPSPPTNLQVLH
jgi:hypothetical protein